MRPKVLWLIKGLGLGGAERLLVSAAPHVDRRRFDYEAAFLLPWKRALVPPLEQAGIPTTCLRHIHPYDPRVIGKVCRLLRERRVDLLHLHLPYTGVVGRIAARLEGVPKVVYTEHNLQERYHPLTRVANQLTMGLTDVTIAVSAEVRASLARSPLARSVHVRTVLNGVDVDDLHRAASMGPDARDELGIARDRLVVGVVNVFRPQKRLDLWLQAARLISAAEPRAAFVVVGDGPSRGELQSLAGRLGVQVVFTGLRHDAPRLIRAFDVFMLSSVFEGLPVALLEAMALGRPVVATQVGGVPSLVAEGRHGFLVPPGDPTALAEGVSALLGDPSLRRRMGEASRQHVEDHFSIRRMVRETEQIYDELLDSSPRLGKPEPEAASARVGAVPLSHGH